MIFSQALEFISLGYPHQLQIIFVAFFILFMDVFHEYHAKKYNLALLDT